MPQQDEVGPSRIRADATALGPMGLADAHRPRARLVGVDGPESGRHRETPEDSGRRQDDVTLPRRGIVILPRGESAETPLFPRKLRS